MTLAIFLAVLFLSSSSVAECVKAGKKYYWAGNFKKSVESFENAAKLGPNSSLCHLWLGRAYGRLAETSGFISAPKYALRARLHFEKAVKLAPENLEALSDLFDYYLGAPRFLGGGVDKAEVLAGRMAGLNKAEGHCVKAKLAEKRKKFDEAEEHLRRAVWLEYGNIGRLLDLAKFLAKRGRIDESEAIFNDAENISPDDPGILFARAEVYIKNGRNLLEARGMLELYLLLKPDEEYYPSQFEARQLLKKISEN